MPSPDRDAAPKSRDPGGREGVRGWCCRLFARRPRSAPGRAPADRSMLVPKDFTARREALSGSEGLPEWVVLLEAAADDRATLVDIGTVRAVLRLMGDDTGVGLHCPERIALQVRVRGTDAATALSTAMSRWQAAAVALVPPGWGVVRAEVLTPDEFTRDCEAG